MPTWCPQKEVVQALPKLIKLNPIVVKEVFNRLLGTQHGEGTPGTPLGTPLGTPWAPGLGMAGWGWHGQGGGWHL